MTSLPQHQPVIKYGSAKVAIAGPLANITLAVVFGLLIRFLLPIVSGEFYQALFSVFAYIVWINLLLAVFNLLPIPPLDGSHILFAFLPRNMDNIRIFLAQCSAAVMTVLCCKPAFEILPVIGQKEQFALFKRTILREKAH